jgi:hypothetical protein
LSFWSSDLVPTVVPLPFMLLRSLYPSAWSTCSCLSLHSIGVCKHASVTVWAFIRTLVASLPHCASERPCASSDHATIATCGSQVRLFSKLKYALVHAKSDLTPIIVVMLNTSSAHMTHLLIIPLQDQQLPPGACSILIMLHCRLSYCCSHNTRRILTLTCQSDPHRQPIER